MLHLVGETSAAWLQTALAAFARVVVDHAHCEHKAAVTALSFCSKYPDDPKLVLSLGELARDEAGHFAQVTRLCIARGLEMGHPEKDPYVEALLSHVRKSVLEGRVDRLLCCALIEGRSCERLRMLAEALPGQRGAALGNGVVDDEVCALYDQLWREEATHHLLFIELARRSLERAGRADAASVTAKRLAELAAVEGDIVARATPRPAIH